MEESEETMVSIIEETEIQEQPEPEVEYTVEELLISCVEARPALWDSRLPLKDRSRTIRDGLWSEIHREFGKDPQFPVEFLQKKWRNLRDTFVRIKGEYTPNGSSAKKKKWKYFDLLQFLCDTINYRPTVSNIVPPLSPSPSTSTLSMFLPTETSDAEKKPTKSANIEGAILEALQPLHKVNNPPPAAPAPAPERNMNPICIRISEILNQMPQHARTLLEIKLLQTTVEGAAEYL